MSAINDGEFHAYTQRVNEMVQRVSALDDADARNTALELLQSVMDLHGAVMSRIVELLSDSDDAGRNSLAKLGSDPLVCGLLVLYGVHPLTLEERVGRALEKSAPQLHKQGAKAEVLGINDGRVRVKIHVEPHEGRSSPDKLKNAVEQAILEAAPEVVEIITEGVPSAGFIPLHMIQPATREEKSYEESAARY